MASSQANLTAPGDIERIGAILNNKEDTIKHRIRALFTLKNIGGPEAVKPLLECFDDDSVLLKHEAAYCLGQMKATTAIPKLISVLKDENENVVVRHEAAEALGAIGDQQVVGILEEYKKDPHPEIKQTCEVALGRLAWLKAGGVDEPNQYHSVDPAPAYEPTEKSMMELRDMMISPNFPMYDRYRALFTLRNMTCMKSLMTIAEGIEDTSALFRHEVAFVMGQRKSSVVEIFLSAVLRDEYEHEMVRHECAEAIGTIASMDARTILKPFLTHENRLLRESAEVGMDMYVYERTKQLQYANTLQEVRQH